MGECPVIRVIRYEALGEYDSYFVENNGQLCLITPWLVYFTHMGDAGLPDRYELSCSLLSQADEDQKYAVQRLTRAC